MSNDSDENLYYEANDIGASPVFKQGIFSNYLTDESLFHDITKLYFKEQMNLDSGDQHGIYEIWINLSSDKFKFINARIDPQIIDKSFISHDELSKLFNLCKDSQSKSQDTLDDADLDILLDSPSRQYLPKIPVGKTLKTILIVTNNSLELAGSGIYHKLHTEIVDCKVIKNKPECEFVDDTILLTTTDGLLCSIIFTSSLKPVILQWWSSSSQPRNFKWEICVNPNNKEFCLIDKKKSDIRFFKLARDEPYHFELVNNMHIDRSEIISYCFLNFFDSFLLLTLIRKSRLCYIMIKWDSQLMGRKETYSILVPNGKITRTLIPLSGDKFLQYTSDGIELFSTDQLISYEFKGLQYNRFSFEDILLHKPCPNLLRKLKLIRPDVSQFTLCTIFCTSNGTLSCILSDNGSNIEFLGLTRFRGLKLFECLLSQPEDPKLYNIVVICFSKVFELTINLEKLKSFMDDPSSISISCILKQKAIESTREDGDKLLYFEKKNMRLNVSNMNLWVSSSHMLSSLSLKGITKHLSVKKYLEQFRLFNAIHIINKSSFSSDQSRAILGEDTSITSKNYFLAIGTDSNTLSRSYKICIDDTAVYCEEIRDILSDPNSFTVHYFATKQYTVQITPNRIYATQLREKELPWIYEFDKPITNAINFETQIIAWDKEHIIYYVNDIDSEDKKILKCTLGDYINYKYFIRKIEFVNKGKQFLFLVNHTLKLFEYDIRENKLKNIKNFEKNISELFIYDFITYGRDVLISLENNKGVLGFINIDESNIMKSTLYTEKISIYEFELRRFNDTNVLLFNSEIFGIYDISEKTFKPFHFSKYEKFNSLIQVCASDNYLFALFVDKLAILAPSFSTYSLSNIILKSTRKEEKKFVFLETLNRMLMISYNQKRLESIKMENGKVMSLDSSVLDSFDLILDVTVLKSDNIDNNTNIVISGKGKHNNILLLKVISIIPQPGKLLIYQSACYSTSNVILGPLKSTFGNTFWRGENHHIVRYKFNSQDQTITKLSEYNINDQNINNTPILINDYDIYEDKFIIHLDNNSKLHLIQLQDDIDMNINDVHFHNNVLRYIRKQIKILNKHFFITYEESIDDTKCVARLVMHALSSEYSEHYSELKLNCKVRDFILIRKQRVIFLLNYDGSVKKIGLMRSKPIDTGSEALNLPNVSNSNLGIGLWSINFNALI